MLPRVLLVFALGIQAIYADASTSPGGTPDYSKEAMVIQGAATKVRFSSDGTREWQETLSVRVQSEAAVRQLGVLSFFYNSDNDQASVDYVRVRKADGTVVETPQSSVLDVNTEVAGTAPTYSDLRKKEIPVRGLGVGDVLEYRFRSVQRKPEMPGQFWYEATFINDAVVLEQTLEVSFPKGKYVQVSSPALKSEIREEGDQRIYLWKHSHLELSRPVDKKKATEGQSEPLKVQLTTFKSWEEVGQWWGALAGEQATVTPEIQKKATDLTAGLSTDEEKAKAIYQYVAMRFRYISISFGAGRYRPHSAAEVLLNQYGDCKDKHTLFVALLKAAGIEAWPALIGAGLKFDPKVPSLAQFNHVITVLPKNGKYVWLDTTSEMAPFGLLNQQLRDQQALVIPRSGKAVLMTTPMDPPFRTVETVEVGSVLAADGTLTGHFNINLLGDGAVDMRAGFHQLTPTQWPAFLQQLSYALGFAGDVSGVSVDDLDAVEKPLRYQYDYKRENYSAWKEHRITPPLPPLGFGPGDEAESPKEAFGAGSPGDFSYRASVQLPKGFSIQLPPDSKLTSSFAEYSAHYALQDGKLLAERKMTIKKSKVAVSEWGEYKTFYKGLQADQSHFITLTDVGGSQAPILSRDNAEAGQLLQKAYFALRDNNLNEARDLLSQAKQINSQQTGLWALYGSMAAFSGSDEEAIEDYRKELQYHPDELPVYQALSALLIHVGRSQEVAEIWKKAVSQTPEDATVALQAASAMVRIKRYSDVPSILEKAIAASPDNFELQAMRVEAELRDGQKDQGLAQAQRIGQATADFRTLNNLAFALADTDTGLDTAQRFAQKTTEQAEQASAKVTLAGLVEVDLRRVSDLVSLWDTLGWVDFKRGDLAGAEKYLQASWQLGQQQDTADHLGHLYVKEQKRELAIHLWRLSLAVNSEQEDAREQLRKAGVRDSGPFHLKRTRANPAEISTGEELGKLRTIAVPALSEKTGSAEYFLLVSRRGIEDVQFIEGADQLKLAGAAIQAAQYAWVFPDEGPEKVVRRGILSCSEYTKPNCQLTLLTPSTVHKNGATN